MASRATICWSQGLTILAASLVAFKNHKQVWPLVIVILHTYFFWFLVGDWSREWMLVSQKRPIRLMQIYDTESAKLLLLMSQDSLTSIKYCQARFFRNKALNPPKSLQLGKPEFWLKLSKYLYYLCTMKYILRC